MVKIVINRSPGWFRLSERANALLEIEENSLSYEDDHRLRADPKLVRVVERLGSAASDIPAKLVVVEVPDDAKWDIYVCDDGTEFVYDTRHVWGLEKTK